ESTIRTEPDPVTRPGRGAIAAALALLLSPRPGRLSNGAASFDKAASYLDGLIFGSGADPASFMRRRTSSASGASAGITLTPICSGSVQPAASQGRSGRPPGYCRRSG